MLILHVVVASPTGGPEVISGCNNRRHILQLKIHCILSVTATLTRTYNHDCVEWSWGMVKGNDHGFGGNASWLRQNLV